MKLKKTISFQNMYTLLQKTILETCRKRGIFLRLLIFHT